MNASKSVYEDEQTPTKHDDHLDRSLPICLKKVILELSFGDKEDHDPSPTNGSGSSAFGRSPTSTITSPQHHIDVESTAAVGDYNEINIRGQHCLEGRNELSKDGLKHQRETIGSNKSHNPDSNSAIASNLPIRTSLNTKPVDDSVWKKIRNHVKQGFKYSKTLMRRNKGKFCSSDGRDADSNTGVKKHKRNVSASSTRALTGIECVCSLSPITFGGKNADLIEELEQRQEVENREFNRNQIDKEYPDSITARRRSETYAVQNQSKYIRRGSEHYTSQRSEAYAVQKQLKYIRRGSVHYTGQSHLEFHRSSTA